MSAFLCIYPSQPARLCLLRKPWQLLQLLSRCRTPVLITALPLHTPSLIQLLTYSPALSFTGARALTFSYSYNRRTALILSVDVDAPGT